MITDKNEIPKVEQIQPNKMYAFSLNPSDPIQHWGDVDRLKRTVNYMKKLLRSPSFEYKLYIELSPKGRIHGHGWIWVADPYNFILHDVRNIIDKSTICIKDISDHEVWLDYVTKQAHIMLGYKNGCIIQRLLPLISDEKVITQISDYYNCDTGHKKYTNNRVICK